MPLGILADAGYESVAGLLPFYLFPHPLGEGIRRAVAEMTAPPEIFADPVTTREDVEGVECDHIAGDLDLDALANVLVGRVVAEGAAPQPSAADLEKARVILRRSLRKAHLDVWVGTADHRLHRVALELDAAMSDADQKTSGLPMSTFHLVADASAVDVAKLDVAEPDSARPGPELEPVVVKLLKVLFPPD